MAWAPNKISDQHDNQSSLIYAADVNSRRHLNDKNSGGTRNKQFNSDPGEMPRSVFSLMYKAFFARPPPNLHLHDTDTSLDF